MVVRLSALRADRPLLPGIFLVLISVRGLSTPGAIVRLKGLGQLKKPDDLIETRTRDLPACSIVSKLTYVPPSIVTVIKRRKKQISSIGNSCNYYSGDVWFESRSGYRLFSMRSFLDSLSQGNTLNLVTIVSFHIFTNSFSLTPTHSTPNCPKHRVPLNKQ
jgi:hypothetical protein